MNGYIQVEINGKKVGLKFNMYAAENLNSIKGNPTSGANIIRMVWAGIIGNAFIKQIEPEVSFEEVADWAEILMLKDDADNTLQKIVETFLEAQPVKVLMDKAKQQEEEEAKKKPLTGTTSIQ